MIDLKPFGDRGFLARFATDEQARGWHRSLEARSIPGILDLVLAYNTVAVHADPDRIDLDELARRLGALESSVSSEVDGRVVRIPVLYDGEDLDEVARQTNLTIQSVVEAHFSSEYRVKAIGFLPGFPYCGHLTPELAGLARRSNPRIRVPAGSVAIVGKQTGIYPAESPGGWHLIGRTPLVVADLETSYFPIRPGDRIRFVPIDPQEYQSRKGERLRESPPGTAELDRL